MPASKEEIEEAIRRLEKEVEELVSALPESAWDKGVYENGWTAKQLLCHLASTSGAAGYLVSLASSPGGSAGSGGGLNVDDLNAQQVARRQGRTVAELLEEIRNGYQRSLEVVRALSQDQLKRVVRTPWGPEGRLADLLLSFVREHDAAHLRDLAAAVRS